MSKIKTVKEEQLELTLDEPKENSKPRFIICVGIPASGKTLWAYTVSGFFDRPCYISERDKLRAKLHTTNGSLNTYKYSGKKEKEVTDEQERRIRNAAESGMHVIVSDTNLNSNTRNRLVSLADELGYEVEYKVFDEPLHVCTKRNLRRDHTVPESVLISMERKMRQYLGKPIYEPYKGLPSCIIVDVDGTLANHTGVRGPYDWDKVNQDKPRENIIKLVQKYKYGNPVKVIIFTGRDGSCKNLTEQWLKFYNVPYDEIHIRPEGNKENDSIIKEKMYTDHIYGKYNVDFVIDDRKQVCMKWESMGLDVINVGGFESDF